MIAADNLFSGYSRKKSAGFNFAKYIFLLLFPLLGVVVMIQREGIVVLKLFILSSIVGTVLEWLIGFSYQQILGKRLWTYNQYSITKYTSILSLPLWGLAGVLMWLLVKD